MQASVAGLILLAADQHLVSATHCDGFCFIEAGLEFGYPVAAADLEAAMDMNEELIAEYDRELISTRKMLEAIPADTDFNWKANPKNMTLGRLAAHVTETAGGWAISALSKDALVFDMASYQPWRPETKAEVLAKFDEETAQARQLLAALPPAKWQDKWTMTAGDQVWIDDSRYRVFRTWVLNHLIHHRAQLGRDLRTLGAPIPGAYGPSADES